jgi:hypothetical protein
MAPCDTSGNDPAISAPVPADVRKRRREYPLQHVWLAKTLSRLQVDFV